MKDWAASDVTSASVMGETKVYVVDSRTDHGEWKSTKFSDKSIAQDFADALIARGFVVRFLTLNDKGKLEFEWEAVAERTAANFSSSSLN